MEEIQTKKLNLRALKKPSSEEWNSSKEEIKANKGEWEPSSSLWSIDTTKVQEKDTSEDKKKEENLTPVKKISLGMLKKDDIPKKAEETTAKISEEIKDNTEKKEEERTHITRVNLKWTSSEDEEKKEENSVKTEAENNIIEAPKKTDETESSASMKVEDKEEKSEEIEEKHTIASPEENHNNTAVINAVIGVTEEEKSEETEETNEAEEVHFQNYESSFKDQSTKVIERIRNFRYTPKTRKWLVLSLIVFITCFISGIMVFIPNHPLNEYKANLLETYNEMRGKQDTSNPLVSNNPFPEIKREDEWSNELGENDENINNTNDEDSSLENNKDTENIPSQREIRINEKKKEVLRNHLLEKYSK